MPFNLMSSSGIPLQTSNNQDGSSTLWTRVVNQSPMISGTPVILALSATAASTTAFSAQDIFIVGDQNYKVSIDIASVATSASQFMPKDHPMTVHVPVGCTVSVIQNAASGGSVYISQSGYPLNGTGT